MEGPVDGGRPEAVDGQAGVEARVMGLQVGDLEGVMGRGACDVPTDGNCRPIL